MDSPFTMVPGRNTQGAQGEVVEVVGKPLHTRRTHSFSSSFSSSSSSFRSTSMDSNPENLDSPLCGVSSPQFSRIPFKWEQLPGIPKESSPLGGIDPSRSILPLPPAATFTPSKKLNFDTVFRKKASNENSRRDPFAAALAECSKDLDQDDELDSYWKKGKISRGVSDRFGLFDRYVSCKSSCAVVQSVVFLPRSSRTTYNLSPQI